MPSTSSLSNWRWYCSRSCVGVGQRGRGNDDQPLQPFRVGQGELQRHEAAHGHARENAFLDAEVVQEGAAVLHQVFQRVGGGLAREHAAVAGDGPVEPPGQVDELGFEHRRIHQRAVAEDHRRPRSLLDVAVVIAHGDLLVRRRVLRSGSARRLRYVTGSGGAAACGLQPSVAMTCASASTASQTSTWRM